MAYQSRITGHGTYTTRSVRPAAVNRSACRPFVVAAANPFGLPFGKKEPTPVSSHPLSSIESSEYLKNVPQESMSMDSVDFYYAQRRGGPTKGHLSFVSRVRRFFEESFVKLLIVIWLGAMLLSWLSATGYSLSATASTQGGATGAPPALQAVASAFGIVCNSVGKAIIFVLKATAGFLQDIISWLGQFAA